MFLKSLQFKGKHLCYNFIIKEKLQHRSFPVKMAKPLKAPFSKTAAFARVVMIMMMMMMMMMMNCFCGMVNWWKVFSLISSQDYCQRSSPLWISDMPRAGFEPAQNLSSSSVEWSCAVVITTTPCRHMIFGQIRSAYFTKWSYDVLSLGWLNLDRDW